MNVGIEETIAISLILVSALVLAATGWQRIGQLLTWSYSLSVLGAILLAMNFVLEGCHPPREGIITDALGRVAPDELSILGAYSTALGLILVGIVCFLIAVHRKTKANKSWRTNRP